MATGRFLGLAALLTVHPLGVVASPHSPPPLANLTVSIFNDAGEPEKVLSDARARATFILARAGISLTWIDCGTHGSRPAESGCSSISFPAHLSVRLVRSIAPSGEDTFGQAFLDVSGEGSYANVYIGALRSSKAANFLREGDLLGTLVVHEVGHLLLGPNSHGPAGLMSARWQPAELQLAAKGLLTFTSEETMRLRSRYLSAIARNRPRVESERTQSGS
jgi:hypothetical protein